MFNLETAISEWRKQMLAAGIPSPVPLDELEAHLREEIERQIESEQTAAEAFEAAVLKFGQAQALRKEFKTVEAANKMRPLVMQTIRAMGLILGWLLAGFMLFAGGFSLDLHWNLFSFHPKWDPQTVFIFFIILVGETGIWFLAKAGRDRASRVVSLLICLLLTGLAIAVLPPEHLSGGFLGRSKPSPFWYRGGDALLLCLPAVFWTWWERRHVMQERDSSDDNQPVCSH